MGRIASNAGGLPETRLAPRLTASLFGNILKAGGAYAVWAEGHDENVTTERSSLKTK